jgi:hypothetical protein
VTWLYSLNNPSRGCPDLQKASVLSNELKNAVDKRYCN